MKLFSLIVATTAFLTLSGCSNLPESMVKQPSEESLSVEYVLQTNQAAADKLIEQSKTVLAKDAPLIVATIVNIDNLDVSSTLGRMISEQVSARFTNASYKMIEMKFQNSVYMKHSEGELMLTRKIAEIAQSHNAQAVVVGTYAIGASAIFVNLKVVQPTTNVVLAATDYVLPDSRNLRSLLSGQKNVKY